MFSIPRGTIVGLARVDLQPLTWRMQVTRDEHRFQIFERRLDLAGQLVFRRRQWLVRVAADRVDVTPTAVTQSRVKIQLLQFDLAGLCTRQVNVPIDALYDETATVAVDENKSILDVGAGDRILAFNRHEHVTDVRILRGAGGNRVISDEPPVRSERWAMENWKAV